LAGQARLRASTAGPRLRARAADGGEPAPRYADLARRPTVFITRPISAGLMAVVFVLLAIAVLQSADWLRRVEPGDTDARWPIRNPIRCLNVTTGVGRTAPLDDQE
jgi:hypothetical protein